jgi:hypothetical protein
MNSSALRFFALVCLGVVLCFPVIPLESVLAQTRNLFDTTTPNPRIPREVPTTSSDDMDRISRSLQRAFADETQQSQTLVSYGIFLGVATAIIAGFLGWQVWRQKRMARELSDPIFLVYELNAAHQLSEPEKRLMQELSEKHSLPTSLKLFIEPKYLLDALDNETFASLRPEVQQLLYKLFDVTKA